MKRDKVTSAGHKFGQIIGEFLEDMFSEILEEFCSTRGFYCDKKGLRPHVRGNKKKLTWFDSENNPHDLDFVIEKNGSNLIQGQPAAFIEIAWRRYVKHSRNKAGEIEGALPHLQKTYPESCAFLGAIIAGEWTEGGINQMQSHGINVLYIPFIALSECFNKKNINLNYPENAPESLKNELIQKIYSLTTNDLSELKKCIKTQISTELEEFILKLEKSLVRKVNSIRIFPLFGEAMHFNNLNDAIKGIQNYSENAPKMIIFQKYELYVTFENGDEIKGIFTQKERAIEFLKNIAK